MIQLQMSSVSYYKQMSALCISISSVLTSLFSTFTNQSLVFAYGAKRDIAKEAVVKDICYSKCGKMSNPNKSDTQETLNKFGELVHKLALCFCYQKMPVPFQIEI